MHWLETLVQMTVFNNSPQGSNNFSLEVEVHGQVRIVPVTHNAHSLKVFSLLIDLPSGISAAALAKLRCGYLVPWFAHFLFNIKLDR